MSPGRIEMSVGEGYGGGPTEEPSHTYLDSSQLSPSPSHTIQGNKRSKVMDAVGPI